jgi:hypothetical protein
MKKILVFLKGSSIHRTAFFDLSTLYPSIELSTKSLEDFNQEILSLLSLISDTNEPLHVIGLGDYSGRNNKSIRLELICKNKFRNTIIDAEPSYRFNSLFENLYLENNTNISPILKFKTTGMGNNFCNLFSYKVNKYISELPQDLKSKIYFDFLHVPSQFHTTDVIAQFLGGTNTHLLY